MQTERNQTKSCNIWRWIFGNNVGELLSGIGAFLLGFAALIALSQTSEMLARILQIQKQAGEIEETVNMLRLQLIANRAIKIVNNSSLKNPDATPEQIQEDIAKIPSSNSCNNPIYLPQENKNITLEKLQQNTSIEARTMILQNSLEYKAPSSCYK